MHHANHYYGHSHVLARWCGLDPTDPPRLAGYLQHGWNIGDGMAPDHEFVPGAPLFVWSERTRRRAWVRETHGTYIFIRLLFIGIVATRAEHLGDSLELGMNLKPYGRPVR